MGRWKFSSAILSLALLTFATVPYGCTADQDSARTANRSTNDAKLASRAPAPKKGSAVSTYEKAGRALDLADPAIEPATSVIDARPVAMVDGRPVTWGELRPILNDMAGAEALDEVLLERKLKEELDSRGILITEDDVASERKALIESLDEDPDTALRLLDELRHRQRLGKTRFAAMMRRNAGLRALVRDDVKVTEAAVSLMQERLYGPRRQARLIVVKDLQQAQLARTRVRTNGESFAEVAVDVSLDSSAARGGLLEPISRADAAYPESLRRTLFALRPGDISGPILLGDQYAIIQVLKEIPGTPPSDLDPTTARAQLERAVRTAQERLLMDQLARQLMGTASVNVFDEQINESWKRDRRP